MCASIHAKNVDLESRVTSVGIQEVRDVDSILLILSCDLIRYYKVRVGWDGGGSGDFAG